MIKEFKQKTTFRLRQAGKPFGWQKDFYDHIIQANEDLRCAGAVFVAQSGPPAFVCRLA